MSLFYFGPFIVLANLRNKLLQRLILYLVALLDLRCQLVEVRCHLSARVSVAAVDFFFGVVDEGPDMLNQLNIVIIRCLVVHLSILVALGRHVVAVHVVKTLRIDHHFLVLLTFRLLLKFNYTQSLILYIER